MRLNKIRKRSRAVEQAHTISKLFAKHDIDLAYVEAGVALLNSQAQAKRRTKERADYIAKGIKFKFNLVDRLAVLEIIKGDNEFWQAWIKQYEIFKRTGLEDDRPTIHRIDSNGHYEFGNIAVLSQGEHHLEHAKAVILFDTDAGRLTTYRSQTAFQDAQNVNKYQVRKMNKAFQADKLSSKK